MSHPSNSSEILMDYLFLWKLVNLEWLWEKLEMMFFQDLKVNDVKWVVFSLMTVHFVSSPSSLIYFFYNSGYDAPEASRRKIVSNVFSTGDKGLACPIVAIGQGFLNHFVRISCRLDEPETSKDLCWGIELEGYDGTPPVLIINTDYSEEAYKKIELGLNKLSKDLQPMLVQP